MKVALERILAAPARRGLPPGDGFAVGTRSGVVGVATAELDVGRVGVLAEDLSGSASSDYLGGISKKIKAEEEEVEEENDSSEAN